MMGGGQNAVLAQLLAQAEGQAADLIALRAIVEEAGTLGATRALARLGLEDAQASKDMAELRELLAAWREAKKSLWKAVLGWIAKTALVLMLAGLAVKLRLWELLK
ncbi:DUF6127 family protein [Sphingomonas hylomeconis]|uniref:DUF6127 family protein n=1 Tax=Sphingomonas hylomeconis TaxID=1395958 RepID=A0ABV7T0V6_9SPHN